MDKRIDPEYPVVGTSPLGGNAIEGADAQHAPVTDTSIGKVPLVYDERVGNFISKMAQMELDDRDIALQKAQVYNEESEFNAKAGYQQ